MMPAKHEKAPGLATQGSFNNHTASTRNSNTRRRLPPFGKQLASLIQWQEEQIDVVVVCVGVDAWARAKHWNTKGQFPALVLPDGHASDAYDWSQINGRFGIVDAHPGPTDEDLMGLARNLLSAGAQTVTVWREWHSKPVVRFWGREASC